MANQFGGIYSPVAFLKNGSPLAIDYTNPSSSTTISAGQGVLIATGHVGFAVKDIGPSLQGALYVGPAVYTIVITDSSTFAQGAAVYFNSTSQTATSTSSGNTLIGYAAAANNGTYVDVVVTLN